MRENALWRGNARRPNVFGNALGNSVNNITSQKVAAFMSKQQRAAEQGGYSDLRLPRSLLSSGVDESPLDLAWLDELDADIASFMPEPETDPRQKWAALDGNDGKRSTDTLTLREKMQASKGAAQLGLDSGSKSRKIITGATLAWGSNRPLDATLSGYGGLGREWKSDPVASYIFDHGQMTISVDGAIAKRAFSVSLTFSKDGLGYYAGTGSGSGLNMSVVYETSIGAKTIGPTASVTAAVGDFFGVKYSETISRNGLEHTPGFGWGMGSAITRTVGYSDLIYKW